MSDSTTKRDPWLSEESGLANDFDGTIARAYFGTDSRYNKGQTLLLILEVTSDDTEVGDQRLVYSCGNNFVSVDNGLTAKHESKGYNANFHMSSSVRHFIRKAFECGPEVLTIMRERDNILGQLRASVWEGMKFHWLNERVEYGPNSGIEARDRLVPSKFLGVVGGSAKATAPAATNAAATAAEPAAPAAAASNVTSISAGQIKMALIKLAKSAETHEAFLEAAMQLSGIENDMELMAELVEEGPEGFFAKFGKK